MRFELASVVPESPIPPAVQIGMLPDSKLLLPHAALPIVDRVETCTRNKRVEWTVLEERL